MSSFAICYDGISSSQGFHQSGVLGGEPGDLSFADKRTYSELVQLLLDWAPLIHPVVGFVYLSSEHLVVDTHGCQSELQLHDVLVALDERVGLHLLHDLI